jgi:hypothetical protein
MRAKLGNELELEEAELMDEGRKYAQHGIVVFDRYRGETSGLRTAHPARQTPAGSRFQDGVLQVQYPTGDEEFRLDDYTKMEALKKLTLLYLEDESVKPKISTCADILIAGR